MLGLQGTEEGLLSTENLDGRTRRLGEVHERSGVGDEARTNKLANKSCQVRSEGLHTVGQVAAKVLTVLGEVNNLLGKSRSRLQIFFCDLSTHRDLCSRLDSRLNLLGQDLREVGLTRIGSETHLKNNTGEGKVVIENCRIGQ